ncbi:MAG: hypothetical protein ACJ8DZ_06615 [Allosphingosinicella sp.]
MPESASRPFAAYELAFLDAVASRLDDGAAAALREDAAAAAVAEESEGELLFVSLPEYQRPDDPAHRLVPFEGSMRTISGGAVSILVHLDVSLRLWEVEFIRWETPSSDPLDWSTLSIVAGPMPATCS